MTNEQNIQTKKWNKLSVGVFCATVINFSFVFLGVLGFFDDFTDSLLFIGDSLIFVTLFINISLTIISIFAIIQARKLNQRGVYLGLASLVLNSLLTYLFYMLLLPTNVNV